MRKLEPYTFHETFVAHPVYFMCAGECGEEYKDMYLSEYSGRSRQAYASLDQAMVKCWEHNYAGIVIEGNSHVCCPSNIIRIIPLTKS